METRIPIELSKTEASALFQLLFFREYPTKSEEIIALEDVRGRVEQGMNDEGWQ